MPQCPLCFQARLTASETQASNPAEASADEQPNGKGPTRPGKEGGSGADPPWDLGGFSAVLGRMPSDAVAGPQLQAEPSSFEVPSSSQDLTPTLWNAAYLRPPTAYQPKSSRGTKDLFRPRIQGRLSPVLLLQVPAIGNRLLQENLRRLLLGKSRPISRQDAIPTGCGLCLSQLEELMLRDASKIPGWKLGPQEPGLFEREANKLAQGLHGEKLRTRVLGVFSLCQLAKRAVAEPSFPSRGHCVLHLVNANVSAFDIPGILHILSWPVAKVRPPAGQEELRARGAISCAALAAPLPRRTADPSGLGGPGTARREQRRGAALGWDPQRCPRQLGKGAPSRLKGEAAAGSRHCRPAQEVIEQGCPLGPPLRLTGRPWPVCRPETPGAETTGAARRGAKQRV